jgi:uncharacterized protein
MSEENVKVVRRGTDAWNRDDLDEWLAGFAQEAEWHTTGLVDQKVYRGREGLARYWAEVREDLDEMNTSVSEIRAIGDHVLVAATLTGRGKRSKVPYKLPVWWVTTVRDGLAVRVESYLDPEQALEAAGLSE